MNVNGKIIELTNKLQELESHRGNIEYETRITKIMFIIEKLNILKENIESPKHQVSLHVYLLFYCKRVSSI